MGYSLQAQADSSWCLWIVLNKDKKQSQLFNWCQYVCAQAILPLCLYPCPAFPAVVEQNGCSHPGQRTGCLGKAFFSSQTQCLVCSTNPRSKRDYPQKGDLSTQWFSTLTVKPTTEVRAAPMSCLAENSHNGGFRTLETEGGRFLNIIYGVFSNPGHFLQDPGWFGKKTTLIYSR